MSGKSDQIMDGLISTKNIFYFIIITLILIEFSVTVLRFARDSRPWTIRVVRYVFIVVCGLIAGYFTSIPSFIGYYDATANHSKTVMPATRQILKQLKDPIKITTYVNLLDEPYVLGLPKERLKDIAFFENYQRFLSNPIDMKYVYYYDSSKNSFLHSRNPGVPDKELAKTIANSQRFDFDKILDPAAIRRIIDLRPEENRFVRAIEIPGKSSKLRTFADIMVVPSEQEIAAALKRLIVSPPKIAFLSGHNERNIEMVEARHYKNFANKVNDRGALINQGFDVKSVSIDSLEKLEPVQLLVIADPTLNYTPDEIAKIKNYINAGGNLMVAAEPGKQVQLNTLLSSTGIGFMEGTLLQENNDFESDYIIGHLSGAVSNYSVDLKNMYNGKSKFIMPKAVGIYYTTSTYSITPIMLTDKSVSWNRIGEISRDSGKVLFNPSLGDNKKSIPTIVSAIRKVGNKEQRIVVMGDADLISNAEMERIGSHYNNYDLGIEMFSWLCGQQFPVHTSRPNTKDYKLNY